MYIQNIAQKEKRSSLLQDKTNESEDLKTLIIRTNGPDFEDPKNVKNLDDGGSRNEILEDNVPAAPVLVQPTTLKIESEVIKFLTAGSEFDTKKKSLELTCVMLSR